MKQVEAYVFRRVLITSLLIVGCAGLFGCALFSRSSKPEITEIARIDEVADISYVPRRDPNAGKASTDVHALVAEKLAPQGELLPTPVYAISGVKGQEIETELYWEVVDIVVILPAKETFSRGLVEGADVSNWILNLPAGLQGRAHNVKKGANTIKIYVDGTPTVTAREEVKVRIPGTYLTGGQDLQFVSPTEAESLSAWEASQTAAQQ
jgi:hypothetical protein